MEAIPPHQSIDRLRSRPRGRDPRLPPWARRTSEDMCLRSQDERSIYGHSTWPRVDLPGPARSQIGWRLPGYLQSTSRPLRSTTDRPIGNGRGTRASPHDELRNLEQFCQRRISPTARPFCIGPEARYRPRSNVSRGRGSPVLAENNGNPGTE